MPYSTQLYKCKTQYVSNPSFFFLSIYKKTKHSTKCLSVLEKRNRQF